MSSEARKRERDRNMAAAPPHSFASSCLRIEHVGVRMQTNIKLNYIFTIENEIFCTTTKIIHYKETFSQNIS